MTSDVAVIGVTSLMRRLTSKADLLEGEALLVVARRTRRAPARERERLAEAHVDLAVAPALLAEGADEPADALGRLALALGLAGELADLLQLVVGDRHRHEHARRRPAPGGRRRRRR